MVQVGTQQRSWDHFQEAKRVLQEKLDPITHVLIQQPGAYSANKQDPVPVPAGLDWDLWQVDAPKKPFKQGYLGFRGWWEYGSGLIGDWGAHHVDVANWFTDADAKAPVKTSAVGFYSNPNIDPECVYNQFSIAWQFDTHIVTFANSVYPRPTSPTPRRPTSRAGACSSSPAMARCRSIAWDGPSGRRLPRRETGSGPKRLPAPGTYSWGRRTQRPRQELGRGRRARAAAGAGAPGGPGGGRGGGGGKPTVDLNVYINPRGAVEEDYPLHVHTRNFLDCLKAKNRKTAAPMEVGYNSALPCLLALEAMQQNRVLGWDAAARTSKAL